MFGKFRRRTSKPHEDEACSSAVVEGLAADVRLMGFRKLPSFSESPELLGQSSNSADEKQDLAAIRSMSSSCHSSPLMNFHKHLFGSFKGRSKINGVGKDHCSSDRKNDKFMSSSMTGSLCESSNTTKCELTPSIQKDQHEVAVLPNSGLDDSMQTVIRKGQVGSSVFSLDDEASTSKFDDLKSVNPPPPRLLRREKIRSNDLVETRKSRLSSHLKDSIILPSQSPRRTSKLVVDVACKTQNGLHNANSATHLPYGERDIMLHTTSNSDFLPSSAEPSSASSTDSGIQSSLYGSTDDRNNSSIELCCSEESRGHPFFTNGFINGGVKADSATITEKWQSNNRRSSRFDTQNVFSQEPAQNHFRVGHTPSATQEADYIPVDRSVSKAYQMQPGQSVFNSEHSYPRKSYACEPSSRRYDNSNELCDTPYSQWSQCQMHTSFPGVAAQQKYAWGYDHLNDNVGCNTGMELDGFMKDSLIISSGDMNSEDDEILPPLPDRNYIHSLNRVEEAFLPICGNETLKTEDVCDDDEQTHMSWAEVIKEARSLGIPLAGPKAETSNSRMSASLVSAELNDSIDGCLPQVPDRMTVSEVGFSDSGDIYNHRRSMASDMPGSCQLESSGKSASPFKDRFRLQNLFSRKKNRKTDSSDNLSLQSSMRRPTGEAPLVASPAIQQRHLPPLPSTHGVAEGIGGPIVMGNSLEHIPASLSSGGSLRNGVNHRTVSALTLPSRDYPSAVSRMTSGSARGNVSTCVLPGSSTVSAVSLGGSTVPIPDVPNRDVSSTTYGDIDPYDEGNNMDFMQSFVKLRDCGWYWGPLGWEEAEMKLVGKPDGSFLVRDSSDDRYILSISFRSQGVTHHTRIEHFKGQFSFYSQPKSHGAVSIVDFMERAMAYSRSGQFLYFLRPSAPGLAPAPVQLLYPISRLNSVPSLQHLCRFVIASRVRRDLIDYLPTPSSLKEYLKQTQYYAMT